MSGSIVCVCVCVCVRAIDLHIELESLLIVGLPGLRVACYEGQNARHCHVLEGLCETEPTVK